MINLKDKYNGKKVFITGITGFKGSWLALMLDELGAEVSGLGLPQEDSRSIFYKANIEDFAKVHYVDIRDTANPDFLLACLDMNNADYIFHLAAQPIVSVGYRNPIYTFDVNVMGTMFLHRFIAGIEKNVTFVNITTDKVYKPSDKPHEETDELGAIDPYSLSKVMSEQITELYRNQFFGENIKSLSVRAGNVIGGGDYSQDRIITDLINSIEKSDTLHLRNPNSVRPYQYVLDCLAQYLVVAAYGKETAYNIGPSTNMLTTTMELVEAFEEINENINYDFNAESIGQEARMLYLNTDRFHNEFNIEPFCESINQLAKLTYNWYNKNINNEELENFSREQIREVLKHYEKD